MTITYGKSGMDHPLICSICRNSIKEQERVAQTNVFYGLVCSSCQERFKHEDLDFIASLITAYGGYFGKLPREDFDIDSLIKGVPKGGGDKLTEMQVKIFHNGLQYGISPSEVEHIIKDYLKKFSSIGSLIGGLAVPIARILPALL